MVFFVCNNNMDLNFLNKGLRVLFLKYIYMRALKVNKIKIFSILDRFIDFLKAFFKPFD
jgi:hypothetical protein